MCNVEVNLVEFLKEKIIMVYFFEEVLNKFFLESYKEKFMYVLEVMYLDD